MSIRSKHATFSKNSLSPLNERDEKLENLFA